MPDKKVVARLVGGLGNQMFIYAAARALALRNGAELVLDVTGGFKEERFGRTFLLDNFKVLYQKAGRYQRFDFPFGNYFRAIFRHAGFIPLHTKYISEKPSGKTEIPTGQSRSIYLDGYWQSEDYFADFSQQIRNDFIFPAFKDEITNKEASGIINCKGTPVAVGVRRYQENQGNSQTVDIGFYLEAIDYMRSKVGNPVFYIFSEDFGWCRSNLPKNINMVLITPKEGVNDMYLMSLCTHHIISNSSFYWWGAWLADRNSQIVIAADCFPNTRTILPQWVRM